MGLPINFNPYAPVPNGPFYSTQESTLAGPWYPLVVGAGLTVDYGASTLSTAGISTTFTVGGVTYTITNGLITGAA